MWFRYALSVAALLALEDSFWCCGEQYYHVRQGSCDSGQFECDDNRCLGMDVVCDNENNCRDRKDEKGCICYGFDMFSCDGRCVSEKDFCRGDTSGCSYLIGVIDCSQWPTTPKPTESSTGIIIETTTEYTNETTTEISTVMMTETSTKQTTEITSTEETTEDTTVITAEKTSDKTTEPTTEQITEIIAETTAKPEVEFATEPTSEEATETTPRLYEDSGTESIPDTNTTDTSEASTVANISESIFIDSPRGEHFKNSAEISEEESDWKSYAIPGGIIIGLLPVSLIIFLLIRRRKASAVYKFSPYESQTHKC